MNQKEIYASVEFVQQEIRFVLGEFHNSRLNILNVEVFPTTAILNDRIVNSLQLISDLKELIATVNMKMKVEIKKVLVVLPNLNFNRYSKRLTIGLYNKQLNHDLVMDTIYSLSDRELANDETLVNYKISKYFIDGIAKNKIDYSKSIKGLAIDVDLYAGDKLAVYDYLNIVEKAGLEIIDITFDSMAMASEMAAFEASNLKNIIVIRYEYDDIQLSLISEQRILSSVSLDTGYGDIVTEIFKEHNISNDSASKLVLSNNYLLTSDKDVMPVFLYSNHENTVAIYNKYLKEIAMPILHNQFEEVYSIIDPIMMSKETDIYLTGKGASIVNIEKILSDILRVGVKKYIPEVIGARSGALVSNLGALYLYRDNNVENRVVSVEEEIKPLEKGMHKYIESDDSMTNRFKELFKLN